MNTMRLTSGLQAVRYLLSTKLVLGTSGPLRTRAVSCCSNQQHILQDTPRPLLTTYSQLRFKMSQARQNYHEECEAGVNRQINLELYASYVYQSIAYHFDRDDVALPGFHKFFKKQSDEEREHAEKLMKYQNMRGGRIALHDIKKPDLDEWGTGLEAMTTALQLEKKVNEELLALHKIAEAKGDAQMGDFLEGEFLKEQVESIKQISDYVTQLAKCGPGLGEYMFDKENLQE